MSAALSPIPVLRPGDTVAVVAPSGPVPQGRLKAGLDLLSTVFRLQVSSDIFREQEFLAGSDERRAEEFNTALADPQVRAVWAARGGYGASRILGDLDKSAMRRDPKVIVGFSDITALHCWAAQLGFQSMHAPVVTQLGELAASDCQWALDMLLGKLDGALLAEDLRGPSPRNSAESCPKVEGRLIGGNLSLLAHLCGTEVAPEYAGSLCIIEDIGEKNYAIDRYVTQLLAQKQGIGGASAVLLGDFTRCGPEGSSQKMLSTRFETLKIPWAAGLEVGHGTRNRAFPHGGMASLEHGTLRLLAPLVA